MGKMTLKNAREAIVAHHGIISKAAEACGVTRKAFYAFMAKHPEIQELREEATEVLLDIAESTIVRDLNAGDSKTTRWYLERIGKGRGYVPRQESTGADGGPLEHSVVERRIVDPEGGDEE